MATLERLAEDVDALCNACNTCYLALRASRAATIERAPALAVLSHLTDQLALVQIITRALAEGDVPQGCAFDPEGESLPF